MERFCTKRLKSWYANQDRKPLILEGARQVGKTYLLKAFAKEHVPDFHVFDFERNPELHSIFATDLDPKRILNELSFIQKKLIKPNHLVIFDEIQACPRAITSLKYFCEDLPAQALCAAGSLLGIYLSDAPYPVGKVDHLTLRPLSFPEFLMAQQDDQSLAYLDNIAHLDTFPDVVHKHLWDQLKIYFAIGGLPEVVSAYCQHKHEPLVALTMAREIQQSLIKGYYADIAKHSGKINAMHIHRVWESVPAQLAKMEDSNNARFRFNHIIENVDRYARMTNIIDWLESAGLVHKLQIVSTAERPLTAYIKESRFKLYSFDIGILGALGNINIKEFVDFKFDNYKGYIAENQVLQSLYQQGVQPVFSWQDKQWEIEFIYEGANSIVPIEVKSGKKRGGKSLRYFSERYQTPRVVFNAHNLKKSKDFYNIPLYAAAYFNHLFDIGLP